MKRKVTATVHEQNMIAKDIYEMWLTTDLAKEAKPGQFVNVYPKDKSTLLPRPISICEVDKARNRMRIVYRLNGKGTREFSAYRAGDPVSVMGCLGNGYPMDELSKYRNICLMGGGIGIPPMLQLAKELTCEKTLVMGYRNDDLFLNQDLWKYGTLYIATEDRNKGERTGCSEGESGNHGCNLCLRSDAYATRHQAICRGASYSGLYFPGGENGLRCRCVPWMCM